jgi:hypothetical protein
MTSSILVGYGAANDCSTDTKQTVQGRLHCRILNFLNAFVNTMLLLG